MTDVTPNWKHVFIGSEGSAIRLDTLDPWELKWHSLEEPAITVAHPNHPDQRHVMHVYVLRSEGRIVRFAGGEYSNGVWGIYVPHSPAARQIVAHRS